MFVVYGVLGVVAALIYGFFLTLPVAAPRELRQGPRSVPPGASSIRCPPYSASIRLVAVFTSNRCSPSGCLSISLTAAGFLVLLVRRAVRDIVSGCCLAGAPHRSHKHNGLYASAVKPLPNPGSFCTTAGYSDRAPAGSQRALPDGCPGADLVRDGGRYAARPPRCSRHHFGPAQHRGGGEPDHGRVFAGALQFRLAAGHRWRDQQSVRSGPIVHVPKCTAARGTPSDRYSSRYPDPGTNGSWESSLIPDRGPRPEGVVVLSLALYGTGNA